MWGRTTVVMPLEVLFLWGKVLERFGFFFPVTWNVPAHNSSCGLQSKRKFYMNTHISNMSNFSHCFSNKKTVGLSGYQRCQWVRCEAKLLLLSTYPRLKNLHSSILISVLSAELPWKAFCLERSGKGIISFSLSSSTSLEWFVFLHRVLSHTYVQVKPQKGKM